jgi:hypothetical protein
MLHNVKELRVKELRGDRIAARDGNNEIGER